MKGSLAGGRDNDAKADLVTAMPAEMTFTTVRGHQGLLAIASEWALVVETLDRPDFFHQYKWYEAILQAWPEEADDILFVVAYRGSEAVAIFPLQLSRSRTLGIPVRSLRLPDPNYIAYPDFIYARSARNSTLFSQLLDYLRSGSQLNWDILDVPRVFSSASVVASATVDPPSAFFSHPREFCYYFRCDEGMQAIEARISNGLRKHIRRCRRQLCELGDVEFVSSRDPAMLPDLFDQFLSLEASGWKGVAGEATAIKLDPALVEFYSGLLARFAQDEACEVNLLRLGDTNIAGQFCLLSGGTWYHLKIAYDEAFEKYSPGFVLLENVLGRLCKDEDVHTANFLTGAEWGQRWHPNELEVVRLIAHNRTVRGRLAMQEARTRRFIRERAIPLAGRFGKR
jgi:CelD/BcsL family acetyltransferase involved in cellulose biosynthesis